MARSSVRASSAPQAGSACRPRSAGPRTNRRARGARRSRRAVHELGEAGHVELADAIPVRGERGGTLLRLVEQLLDARVALPVDERLDVPRDIGGGAVVVVDGHGVSGHVGEPTTPRPARPWASHRTQGFGQWLGVHDHETPRRSGQHDVQQAQPAVVVGDEPRRLHDDDLVELEALGLDARRARRSVRRARRPSRRRHRHRRARRRARRGDRRERRPRRSRSSRRPHAPPRRPTPRARRRRLRRTAGTHRCAARHASARDRAPRPASTRCATSMISAGVR